MRNDPSDLGAESDPEMPEPANLRFLRRLVTVLTITMIGGVITVITLLVIRLQSPAPNVVDLPDQIELPEGVAAPQAVTFGDGWTAVVAGDEILIFGTGDGALRQRIDILNAPGN